MNFKSWMMGLIGLNAISEASGKPYTTVARSEITEVLAMVNGARRRTSVYQPAAYAMPLVTWDYNLENALESFRDCIDPEWLFQKNQTASRYNGEDLMNLAPFNVTFKDHGFFTHDGCENTPNALSRNFAMRAVNQANCFDYNNCADHVVSEPGSINGYETCMRANITHSSHLHCSWSWQYYPMIVNDNVKTIACMLAGIPGDNEAGYRPNHLFCYYGIAKPQTTEKPYVAVGAGQKAGHGCPGKVVDKLCL